MIFTVLYLNNYKYKEINNKNKIRNITTGRICTSGNNAQRNGLDSSGSRQGPMASSCEHGNRTLGAIKDRKILDYLSDY